MKEKGLFPATLVQSKCNYCDISVFCFEEKNMSLLLGNTKSADIQCHFLREIRIKTGQNIA